MVTQVGLVVFLVTLFVAHSKIYLDTTNDSLNIEFYDCIRLQSLDYCRRPKDPINLTRNDETNSCKDNSGKVHRFSELQSNNITVNTLVQQWKSTLEQLEQYSLFLKHPNELQNGAICQCLQRGSFGKNCEYQLPLGMTFEETLQWQLSMRERNHEKVQMYGDVVCYETLQCDSGVLCLDWREICDGIQNCLSGRDEENCDVLEMNQCDQEEEYRCMNGMCIPNQFFLDGEFDCLDWSDEKQFKRSSECPQESVNTECDDHLCSPNTWSCGDGQCIEDRLAFQRLTTVISCQSGRHQYFLCETNLINRQWTMENGRCYEGRQYESLRVTNHSDEERCEYLFRCSLSADMEKSCSCYRSPGCIEEIDRVCPSSLIQYPRGAVGTPFTFFLYNPQQEWSNRRPDWIVINGTVRCYGVLINVREKRIPFDINWNEREMIEEHFCRPFRSNISTLDTISVHYDRFNANESHDRCDEWNEYSSLTRINDGLKNCLNGKDEIQETEMQIEKSCASVQRHRLYCSADQPTCLSVARLATGDENCRNGFDVLMFGVGRTISSIGCHNERQDECFLLRQYISQSTTKNNIQWRSQIPFRSHCDTFSDLSINEDENLPDCQRWWICPEDQFRCRSGQCLDPNWLDDWQWDCSDATDEHYWLNSITRLTLQRALKYNFNNRSFFIPSTCPQSDPYLCLSINATRQGFECFNLSQIGDGHIDCAGGQDERNTIGHCSQSSSMLGLNFLCPSTNTCIPYYLHCTAGHRCPRRSDDELWCERQHRPSSCFDVKDFVCFDGRCLKGGRCDLNPQCYFLEDEYMCDYPSSLSKDLFIPRKSKRFSRGRRSSILRFSLYPFDVNITHFSSQSSSTISTFASPTTSISNTSLSSFSPYWCNRGLGTLLTSNPSTILCFCPPQYYGHKCEYHADRLSVVLHADLSLSIDSFSSVKTDRTFLLKLVVLFLFNDEVLMIDQFHLHPSNEIDSLLNKKKNKLISHFLYPRSSAFLEQRRKRFFNRSSLLILHPFSIQIKLYRTRLNCQPSIIALWKYPLSFSHLPVSRLSKVLHFSQFVNPCSSLPCRHPNEECHQLMNNGSEYICLCRSNFTGENCSDEDQQCRQGYCSMGSLCHPKSLSSLQRDSSPFCLCPLNRFGRRCEIEYDACLSHPCFNNGSCFPDVQLDRVICLCRKEYFGSHCQWKRTSVHISLSTDLPYRGVVLQVLQIDLSSLELILLQQRAFHTIPHQMEYYHQDQSLITGIVLAKVYLSDEVPFSDVYLLSVYQNISSLHGKTNLSSINQCEHRRTFSNKSSPIRYHHICIANPTRLCFRDDVYLCICGENHTRVECFNYNDHLDHCENCRAEGLCLKGDPRRSTDFLCLCPPCHSGDQCQFNTKSFVFTLDQLFSSDLLSNQRRTTISLLIFFSLLLFLLAIPNNLFSFVTLRRRPCLRYGIGHYLLWMSVINQINLAFFVARFIHLIVNINRETSSTSVWDDLLCKSLNYLLSSSSRMVYWLTSLISIERLYTTIFISGQWWKKPHIARRVIGVTVIVILMSDIYELIFYKSFTNATNGRGSICVLQISKSDQSLWITFHLLFLVINSLLPFLINLCSTITISLIIVKKKMKTFKTDPSDQVNQSAWTILPARVRLIIDVLIEKKEFVLGSAITLVPQLFSVPLFLSSFIFNCQNLENTWLRYFLIVSYWISFTPQWTSFFLYISPSSFYSSEWRKTNIRQWMSNLLLRHPAAPTKAFTPLLTKRDMVKNQR